MSRGHLHYRRRIPPALIPVLLVGGVITVAFVMMNLWWIAIVAVCVMASARHRRRALPHPHFRHPMGNRGQVIAPPRPPVRRPPPAPDWAATKARFARLSEEYARFECDPLAVLRTPALADVTVPSTARFVDAYAEAQALNSDERPSAEHVRRFATAVDGAWRAWQAARDAAERIRLAGIPDEEHVAVDRAIKLLTLARDTEHSAERTAAYAKARVELDRLSRRGVLHLPTPAAAALEAASRPQLPG